MDRAINKEIFRLAVPSILANITVPLVGMVDTAIAGHLPGNAPVYIGAIALGSTVFNIIYWFFGFLRTGVGGLTAQSFGRKDKADCARIFARAEGIALGIAVLILLLQWPIAQLSGMLLKGTDEVMSFMITYIYIRIWAAPATLSLYVFSGWFIGMQDSMSSMWKDLIVNGVNMLASYLLAFVAGLGFRGIVWGTVIAQWSGLLFCVLTAVFKYGQVFSCLPHNGFVKLFQGEDMRSYFKMNADLTGRSIGFIVIYVGYTVIAARYGDTVLACSSIMMQLLMLFSYFTDGFAYAGEAMTGRFIGAQDSVSLHKTLRYVLFWGCWVSVLFIFLYAGLGKPILGLLTSDQALVTACLDFRFWMILMPPIGCAAFIFDGFYLGATATKGIRNSMLGALVCFLVIWWLCRFLLQPEGPAALHCLMAAYYAHLAFRAIYLFAKRRVLTEKGNGDGPTFPHLR